MFSIICISRFFCYMYYLQRLLEQMKILIKVDDEIKHGAVAQRAGIISRALRDLAQVKLERIFMDEQRGGCPRNGAVMLKKDFQRVNGLLQLLFAIVGKDFMDVGVLGLVGNIIGKDFHVNLIVKFDKDIPFAQTGKQRLLRFPRGGMKLDRIGMEIVDADADGQCRCGHPAKLLCKVQQAVLPLAAGQKEQGGTRLTGKNRVIDLPRPLRDGCITLREGDIGLSRQQSDRENPAGNPEIDAERGGLLHGFIVDKGFAAHQQIAQNLLALMLLSGLLPSQTLIADDELRHFPDDLSQRQNILISSGDAQHTDGFAVHAQDEIRAGPRSRIFRAAVNAQLVEIFLNDPSRTAMERTDPLRIRTSDDDAALIEEIDFLRQDAVDFLDDFPRIIFLQLHALLLLTYMN